MMCEKRHIWRAVGEQKNTPSPRLRKGKGYWPLMDSNAAGVCHAHPNGPGLFIIAHLFENVKGLRQKNCSGAGKGSCAARLDP